MILSDFTNFLLPDFSDPIQLVFFSIMVLLTAGIVASTHYYAKDAQWTVKWTGGNHRSKASDSLDIEHGSVMDLSHAVATAPEKLADVMPGLLLIIGLLGTFLGLGLALNNASNILSQPDALNPGAAANSMQSLLGMLQGLGTKFKTSTWGIIGFILLKTWSEFARFEEKRLAWVIRKVKYDLEIKEQENKVYEEEKLSKVVQTISDSASKTILAFEFSIEKLINVFSSQEKDRIAREQIRDLTTFELLRKGSEQTSEVCNVIDKNFVTLKNVIFEVNDKVDVRNSELLATVQVCFGEVNRLLNSMTYELKISSRAITEFSGNTESLITGMSVASERMAEGATQVSVAGNGLVSAVESFTQKFAQVLDQMRTELAATITEMSEQATNSLASGSDKLQAATSSISHALTQLSGDVKDMMISMQSSIEQGLDAQNKASFSSIQTSRSLSEQIENSNGMLQKVIKPIDDGLQAISTFNRQQISVQRNLEVSMDGLLRLSSDLTSLLRAFTQLSQRMEPIPEYLIDSNNSLQGINSYLASMSAVKSYHDAFITINNSIERLQSEIKAIKPGLQQYPTSFNPSESCN